MGRRLASAVVLLLISATGWADERGTIDWIVMVDTSHAKKSLFDEVKESAATFVRETSAGESVTIFTFDRDVRLRAAAAIRGEADRAGLLEQINGFHAGGNRRHLGAAIASGIARAGSLPQRAGETRECAIVVFANGREDVRGIREPISIPSTAESAQRARPFLFFVLPGDDEPQLDDFASETDRTMVLKTHSTRELREVADRIRQFVEPAQIAIEPRAISFGTLQAGALSEERDLTLTTNKRAIVSIALEPAAGVKMERHDNITLTPSSPVHVRVRLVIGDDAEPGARELHILVGDHLQVPAIVAVSASSSLHLAKWSGALLLFLVLAGFFVNSRRGRHYLEGEIEIMVPALPPEAVVVALARKRAEELAISSIVSPGLLGDSDARLFCRLRGGVRTVWIAAVRGTLRVNDIELAMTELYDGDTIEVGAVQLRFRRLPART